MIKEDIKLNDKETNITLEAEDGVVPKDTILVVNTINSNYSNYQQLLNIFQKSKNFKMFDINLESNGTKIQPDGKVKISIPVPAEFDKSNLFVYRIEENGDIIEYTVTVKDGMATFETDHFSTYVLAEKEITPSIDNVANEEQTPNNTNTPHKKDKTPKTGKLDIINYVLVATTLAGVGIIVLKKHSK